ncbi:MAG: hypothetical protein ACRYGP_07920 [Janthinobacterium lividum]
MLWELVPRRPRKVLWSLCLRTLSDDGRPEVPGLLSRAKLATGGPGWRLAAVDGSDALDGTYADRDVAVLIRLRLLELDTERAEHVGLTK